MSNLKIEEITSQLATLRDQQLGIESAIAEKIAQDQEQLKTLQQQESDLKEALLKEFRKHEGVKSVQAGRLKASYRAPSKRKVFNTKGFQFQHPDMYAQWVTETEVSDSVTLKIIEVEEGEQ